MDLILQNAWPSTPLITSVSLLTSLTLRLSACLPLLIHLPIVPLRIFVFPSDPRQLPRLMRSA
ncbi:hypothetical protein BDZ45DRAFT_680333 [Acephala macrosclerotiorum]|nr:hypothetical protein BDZ45DRAFT_680333 [Acephala macrosclerotiorum]